MDSTISSRASFTPHTVLVDLRARLRAPASPTAPACDGIFRIVRGVAPDRVISTVDPEACHGHKTAARGFDGYQGHVSIDPDSEIINTVVTPGNAADGSVAKGRLGSELGKEAPVSAGESEPATTEVSAPNEAPLVVYGDSSYGTAEVIEHLESAGAEPNVKAQAPSAPAGKFGQVRQIRFQNLPAAWPTAKAALCA